jgi:integrase/recombinase XerC
LNYLKVEKRYSSHTVVSYKNDLIQFNLYLSNFYSGVKFSAVEMIHIRSYMVNLIESNLAKSSVARKISTIKSVYKFLKKEKIVLSSPVQLIETPKIDSRLPTFLKEEEIVNLFQEFEFEDSFKGFRDKVMMYLLYQSGIRLSELIALKEKDIRNSEVKVLGKRNKERIIPLSKKTNIFLDQYLELKKEFFPKSNSFFVTDKGNKLYEKFVYRKVNHYLSIVSSKQKKSPHILRHTFATHMLNNGADLNSIKEILGHENLSATQVYTHNTFQKLKSIHKQSHPRG